MAVDIHSKQNLEDEVYQKDGSVLLNLWAAWCRPCQVMEPTLKFAEEKFKDKISFCRLEVEEQEALADLFQTVGIPTFVLFKDGKEIGRIIGCRQKAKFVDEIANIIRDGQQTKSRSYKLILLQKWNIILFPFLALPDFF